MPKAPLISIVDDDAPARDGIRELVESLGYRTVAFSSAEHFLESSMIAETMCVITDVQMPGLNSFELQEFTSGRHSAALLTPHFATRLLELVQTRLTVSIGHYDKVHETVIVDLLRERKPRFVPAAVVAEFAQLLKLYGISVVMSDGFAGGFHSDEWTRNGITFRSCPRTTSENYLHAFPTHRQLHAARTASLARASRPGRSRGRASPNGGFCSRRHFGRRCWRHRGGKAGCSGARSANRHAVYLVQNIRRNFRSVSRFSEYHGGVLRLWRLTRSFCPRVVSIMPKVEN